MENVLIGNWSNGKCSNQYYRVIRYTKFCYINFQVVIKTVFWFCVSHVLTRVVFLATNSIKGKVTQNEGAGISTTT